MRVIYLDTSHISQLARFPHDPASRVVRDVLDHGDVCLAVSWIHLQELSSPHFRSRTAVGTLLDSIPITWAVTPDELFDAEVRSAIKRAMIGEAEPLSPFSRSFVHAFGAPPDADVPIATMLEGLAEHAQLRIHLRDAAEYSAQMDARFKKAAAVVRNPKEPILAHIRDLNTRVTPAGIHLARMLSPDEIFERAGGLSGFPAINVAHSLARIRLGDERFPSRPNDVMDEWHACYAPYSAAIALDKGTVARFHSAGLPDVASVTWQLKAIPAILAKAVPFPPARP